MLDDDEKGTQIVSTPGGSQSVIVINESGFYHAALKSRVEKAVEFRRWVTGVILPQIRKTGGYIPVAQEMSDMEIMARGMQIMQRTLEQKDLLLAQQTEVIAEMAPKALFHDAVQGAENAIGISELAKVLTQYGYPIGQKGLFKLLREDGYLGSVGEFYNRPMQRYVEQGLFCVRESVYSDNAGGMHTRFTTKVTGKGQTYFVKKYCGDRDLFSSITIIEL